MQKQARGLNEKQNKTKNLFWTTSMYRKNNPAGTEDQTACWFADDDQVCWLQKVWVVVEWVSEWVSVLTVQQVDTSRSTSTVSLRGQLYPNPTWKNDSRPYILTCKLKTSLSDFCQWTMNKLSDRTHLWADLSGGKHMLALWHFHFYIFWFFFFSLWGLNCHILNEAINFFVSIFLWVTHTTTEWETMVIFFENVIFFCCCEVMEYHHLPSWHFSFQRNLCARASRKV